MIGANTAKPLRGEQRQRLAAQVAADFVQNTMSIRELAVTLGRRPCTVRRLLVEAGVVEYTVACLGPDTDVVARRLAARYRDGESVDALSRWTGIDRREVRRLIRSAGGLPDRPTRPDVATSVLVERYRAGVDIRGLTRETGLSYRAVRERLLAAGVRLRGRSAAGRGPQ